LPYGDLKKANRPLDGTAEWVCFLCRGMKKFDKSAPPNWISHATRSRQNSGQKQ
jgi:hypothetical protein